MRHESSRNRGGWDLQRVVAQSLEQNTRQVAFSEIWQNDHDQFARIVLPACNFDRGDYSSSRRNPHQQTFFLSEAARHVDRFIIGYRNDLIDVVPAQDAGHKPSADAL